MNKVKLLDCTLRDGGYYNDWNYAPEVVSEYLSAMDSACIDYVEIGLRSPCDDRFYGPFLYSTDEFLRTLNLPNKSKLGVMVNAKDYLSGHSANLELLKNAFHKKVDSPVTLVRVASHLNEVQHVGPIIEFLKDLGYEVGLNLMQVTKVSTGELDNILSQTKNLPEFNTLYFADSMGNLKAPQIADIVASIKKNWKNAIGIHAHNNKGQALDNTLAAIGEGVTWVDATVLGMGRGAGNTQTEYLALELIKNELGNYQPEALFKLVLGSFAKLHKEYRWGPNLLYYLSAEYNIHPTYVQTMLGQKIGTPEAMIGAMGSLKNTESLSYSPEKLVNAMREKHNDAPGTWNPGDIIKGREVLILGSGPSAKAHKKAIEDYIARKKPYVISLNIQSDFSADTISAYAACHPVRLFSDIKKYQFLKKPLITPISSISDELQGKIKEHEIYNFGLKIDRESFTAKETGCVLPHPLAVGYALAVATSGKATRILLAGFDGYDAHDPRQMEMNELLDKATKYKNTPELLAITPTTYKLRQSTVYAPTL